MKKKLLAVDDDAAGCRLLQAIFTPDGFQVLTADSGRACLEHIQNNDFAVVILDLHLPDANGIEVLEKIKALKPQLPVIMATAHGELQTAIKAMQQGATDYLTKPINPDEIVLVVRRALEKSKLIEEVGELRSQLKGGSLIQQMGSSPQVKKIVEQVETVALSDFSVLILGETGTGKELVAQAIHRQSSREEKPFVAIDCGAIPETLLESELFGYEKGAFTGADRKKEGQFHLAEQGTFFLDEVGNLPLGLQSKLLRVMESKQVQSVGSTKSTPMNVRFVAATNHDLEDRIKRNEFRSDFYFRLAQYIIYLPPLRDRREDIPYLAKKFLSEASLELRKPVNEMDTEFINFLQRYTWPGNVRQLRNIIRHAVLETKDLALHCDLVKQLLNDKSVDISIDASYSTAGKSLKEIADEAAKVAERRVITETLRATNGNKSQAARILKTDYKTLHIKIKSLGLKMD